MAERPFAQLVVVGASAGGIEALSALLATLPAEFPAPIVIAQHLDPSRTSHLRDILQRASKLPVRTVQEHDHLDAGVVFVVPANRDVEITDSHVSVHNPTDGGPKPSVNRLLSSAAQAFGEGLVAVILTGTGSDGTAGARHVKEAGGMVVIQNPETARYPAMPQSLAPTTVDVIANLDAIGPLLQDVLSGAYVPDRPADDRALRTFLNELRERNGIDFNSYKMPTIMRRLARRMAAAGHDKLADYVRYVHSHPEEYQRLVSSFLIKVTEFFRDADLFQHLRDRVLPDLIRSARDTGNELRLWSAGCATGEEAYSLAILVAEVLGDELEQFTVRIFSTDLDPDAVNFARRGVYPASALANLSPELKKRHFNPVGDEYAITKRARNLTLFGQHDLGQRAPFPRIDLALCRNVLIYFTPDLQRRALHLFAFSLRDNGYLVLGKAESTSQLPQYFVLDEPRLKVYRRQGDRVLIPAARIRDTTMLAPMRLPSSGYTTLGVDPTLAQAARETPRTRSSAERADRLLLHLPEGVVLVDRRYDIQSINSAARRLLSIHSSALGEDFVHLARILPPTPLRAAIDAAFRRETTVTLFQTTTAQPGLAEARHLQLTCAPEQFETERAPVESVVILVADVKASVQQRREVEQSVASQAAESARLAGLVAHLNGANKSLLEANQELTTVNAELRGANEELLVANEEVQAATEEVETLNEELQATNEELETLNEELQATVEELNTTNDDLQARSVELQEVAASQQQQRQVAEAERARLEAMLLSIGDAVLVVDRDGQTLLANQAYDEVFGGAEGDLAAQDGEGHPLSAQDAPRQRAARSEAFSMEFSVAAADGTRHWYEACGQPIISSGDRQGGVVVIRDITERSLHRLQDEFLALATHELRTPLTALQGYLDMLARQLPPDAPEPRRYVSVAREQARLLGSLVHDLMDVGRLQTGKLNLTVEPVDLVPLVAQTVEVGQSLASGQTIHLEAPKAPLRVEGDARRLEQVLLNLLSNAVSYAPNTPRIDVRLRRQGGEAELRVQDYGPGIPATDLTHVFSRFFQVERTDRPSSSGLGLGLYISREIVIAHGGTIDVTSAEGDGTAFTVRLPLATRRRA